MVLLEENNTIYSEKSFIFSKNPGTENGLICVFRTDEEEE